MAVPRRLRADGQNWSTWKAEFALVYVASVNGLLKKAIEKGLLSSCLPYIHAEMFIPNICEACPVYNSRRS